MKVIKVKILCCSMPRWYDEHIGKDFYVVIDKDHRDLYKVVDIQDGRLTTVNRYIWQNDVVVLGTYDIGLEYKIIENKLEKEYNWIIRNLRKQINFVTINKYTKQEIKKSFKLEDSYEIIRHIPETEEEVHE